MGATSEDADADLGRFIFHNTEYGMPESILEPQRTEPRRKREPLMHDLELGIDSVVEAFCLQQRICVEALHLLAWTILLQRFLGQDDVCFLTTLSLQKKTDPIICCPSVASTDITLSVLQRISRACSLHKGRLSNSNRTSTGHGFNIPSIANTAAYFQCGDSGESSVPDDNGSHDMEGPLAQSTSQVKRQQSDILSSQQNDLELHIRVPSDTTASSLHIKQSFDLAEACGFLRSYQAIVEAIVNKHSNPVGSIDAISAHDKTLICKWNEPTTVSANLCLFEILSQQSQVTPLAEAICAWDGTMSYQALDETSTRLGHFLVQKAGILPETLVGFAFEKSLNAVVTMLAILKAGGVYVPLEPDHPPTKVRSTVEDLQLPTILCSPTASGAFVQCYSVDLIIVDNDTITRSQSYSRLLPCCQVKPHNAALLVFTSGTTGKPKGVVIEHNAYATSCRDNSLAMRITSQSRTFQFAAFTYDLAISDVFCAFYRGACVCVPSDHDRLNDIPHAIASLQINLASITPAVADSLDPDEVPTIETLILGGEALPKCLLRCWVDKVKLINIYGITETCAWTTATAPLQPAETTCSIGRPICGQVWIVDVLDFRRLAPIGNVGEILIESPTLARNYLNNISATEKAFPIVPHYLQPGRSIRVYRTGDLARYDHEGNIHFLGRGDSQVKISGQRVELPGIENRIKELLPPDSKVAAVVVRPTGLDPVLVGIATLNNAHGASDTSNTHVVAHVREKLKLVLPPHMIPSLLEIVPSIPKSRTGKIDRAELARWAVNRLRQAELWGSTTREGFLKPVTSTEVALQELWQEIFKLPAHTIGTDASFLHFGDSVSAMRLAKAARKSGYNLDVAKILTHPTLSAMAALCAAETAATTPRRRDDTLAYSLLSKDQPIEAVRSAAASLCSVHMDCVEDIIPCTPLQEGMMALSLRQPGTYLMQEVRVLKNSTDCARFVAAWDAVAQVNSIMRTRIIEQENRLFQVVCGQKIPWDEPEDIQEYLNYYRERVIALGEPLTRFALCHVADGLTFVITRHHATFDGHTLPMIDEQHEKVYGGGAINDPPRFASFVRHIEEQDRGPMEDYWRAQLNEVEATQFPVNVASRTCEKADATWTGEIEFTRPARMPATVSTLVRAAWALLVAEHCATDDVVIGTTLSGRTAPVDGIGDMTAPTIASVPVRVPLDRSCVVNEYLSQLQEQSNAMIPHEQIGLQGISKLGHHAEAACKFASLLIINPEMALKSDSLYASRTSPEDADEGSTFAITVQVWLKPSGARLAVVYDGDLVTSWHITLLVKQLEHILQTLCAHPKAVLKDVHAFSSSDQRQLDIWTAGPVALVEQCVHHIFSEHVAGSPNHLAVVSWDGELTYRELDDLSSRLAFRLVEQGITTEQVIPICFEKSMWIEVSLLGVIKAGAAFLLLDPSHPLSRLQGLVHEVQAPVVLSSETHASLARGLSGSSCIVSKAFCEQLPLPSGTPCSTIRPSSTLYYVFSSGTTGKPKGSVLDHQAYASSALAVAKALGLSKATRSLHFSAYSFDQCIEEILGTLLFGGTVCIPSDMERESDLVTAINQLQSNFMTLTPSFARTLRPSDIPSVKSIVLGGEPMTQQDLDRWKHLQLFDAWGPAECAVTAGVHDVTKTISAHERWALRSTGLRATPSVDLYVVKPNDHNDLTPLGGLGEIVIDGANVAKYYLNEPEMTALAFVQRPQWLLKDARPKGRRLYKTGDLGRYGPDGSIIFMGRKDATQIKLRGQRLELGEVESRLHRLLPDQTELIVEAVKPCDSADLMLVAFLSSAQTKVDLDRKKHLGSNADASLLFDFSGARSRQWSVSVNEFESQLSQDVPNFMIPSAWVPMKFMPSSNSKKVDRKAIKTMASTLTTVQLAELSGSVEDMSLPTSYDQKLLSELWAVVLQVDQRSLGLNHSWFKLGGNSIDAMKLTSMARKRGIILKVADIFQHPRLVDMAAVCTSRAGTDSLIAASDDSLPMVVEPFSLLSPSTTQKEALKLEAAAQCGVSVENIEDIYPCTPLQQGLMAISTKTPGREMAQITFELPSHVNLKLLREAWDNASKSATVLRTRIIDTAAGSFQVIVSGKLECTTGSRLTSYLASDRKMPMQLGGRLCRLALVKDDITPQQHLCLSLHHAVYDGWSLELMIQHVEDLYCLRPAPSSYTPYNVFIAHLINSQDTEKCQRFWTARLDDACPEAFPKLPVATYSPSADSYIESTAILKEHTRASDYTISTFVRAAWAMVVAAHTGTEDVVYGSTVHGRHVHVHGIETIMGPVFTTVPVRVVINKHITVHDYLHSIQQDAAISSNFEHFGLQNIGAINERLRSVCSFQNVLVIQPEDPISIAPSILALRRYRDDPSSLNSYGIMLDVEPSGEIVKFRVSHDSKLVDYVQMRRLIDQLTHVLEQLRLPHLQNATLDSIEVISPADRRQIAVWNNATPRTLNECIHDIIGHRAEERPSAEAVCAWDGSMSYHDLHTISSRLAAYLVQLGSKPGDVIPLCFDKSHWTVVAMLAVMKSGGAFVLLDPAHQPTERMRSLIKAVQGDILICDATHQDTFLRDVTHTVCLTSSLSQSLPESFIDRVDESTPEDILCVLFTSGSTGVPKGIVHNHSGFATSFDAFGPALDITSSTRLLQFSAYAFDACVGDILAPLMHGGCVCIPSEYQRMNDITTAINESRANWALLTPSFARSLNPEQIPGLTTILLGGEAILPSDEVLWSDRKLLTGYGPAESSLCVAAVIGLHEQRHAPNLGFTLGCRAWITDVDDYTQLAPIGAGGHLVIEGPVNAAGGYLNDPERTASSFVKEHVWLAECKSPATQRLFKTGDLVRYASDGSLVFMGRLDTQIKLRGQRVEVDEVEFQLELALADWTSSKTLGMDTPTRIKSAVAPTLQSSGAGTSALALFVCVQDWCLWSPAVGHILSSLLSYVQRRLGEKLPTYMVPDLIIPIPKLPMTASGKLDRKSLSRTAADMPEDELARLTRTTSSGQKPANEAERLLCSLFTQVLRRKSAEVHADDSLLRLGGDSISAMRLVALARTHGLTITVADIFELGTPQKLALKASRSDSGDIATPEPFSMVSSMLRLSAVHLLHRRHGIEPHTVRDIYPCTSLQAGLMSISAIRAGAYVANNVFELPSTIDTGRLQSSWQTVVESNDILRTVIVAHDGAFLQVVLDNMIDVCVVHGNLQQTKKAAAASMGLGTALNQIQIIIESNSDKRYLLWTSHHSTYDGWSMRLLLEQWEQVFQGTKLPHLPPFNRFIKYIGTHNEASAEYWRTQLEVDGLEGAIFPVLPHDAYQPKGESVVTTHIGLELNTHPDITLSTLIRAAWAVVINAWCHSTESVLIGCVVAGRSEALPDIDKIVGPTLTTTPVNIAVQRRELVSTFLSRVQRQSLDMVPHEQYGLQNIAALSEICRRASTFQTLLAIQPLETYSVSSDNLMRLISSDEQDAEFYTHGLTLQCLLKAETFEVQMNYDMCMLSNCDADRLLGQFAHVYQTLATSHDGMNVADVDLLPRTHIDAISTWNSMPMTSSESSCAHERIALVARKFPHRPAVQSWDGTFTFAELHNTSVRLAHYLQDVCDIGPGSLVPTCFEKSVFALISQLAILHAGAAFVPLDPSYPQKRIEQILQQVGATVVLGSAQQAHIFRGMDQTFIAIGHDVTDNVNDLDVTRPRSICVRPDDLMYIIFTSGSTGVPKGVMIEHRAYDASSQRFGTHLGINENSRTLQFASYVFDASILETFTTLSYGGCVCVPSDADRLVDLSLVINRLDANWALLTPTVLRTIRPGSVPGLTTLTVGAEAVSRDVMRSWSPDRRLLQVYGPTEASMVCIASTTRTTDSDPRELGKAFNCHTYIVDFDDHNRLAGLGCVGELLIQGPILARGYLHDAMKTEASFICAPAWMSTVSRLIQHQDYRCYKTGDLVKYGEDGSLIFCGRKDTQVKIRGQRIEIGEIESQLRSLLCKGDSTVVEVVKDVAGRAEPLLVAAVAFAVSDPLHENTDILKPMDEKLHQRMTALKTALGPLLAPYMVPNLFLPFVELPLNLGGKTDRHRIREVTQSLRAEHVAQYSLAKGGVNKPYTEAEMTLQPMWETVLNQATGTVHVEDDFFDYGDSISAIRLSSAARNEGLSLTAAMIFRKRRFGAIAESMAKLSADVHDKFTRSAALSIPSDAVGTYLERNYHIDPTQVQDVYRCVGTQDYLMRQSLNNEGCNAMQLVYRLASNIDQTYFRQAWEHTVSQTDILRTCLVEFEGVMLQVLLNTGIQWYQATNLEKHLAEDRAKPLELGSALARFSIITTEDETYFVWMLHHSLYDGWSLPLMLKRFEETYASLVTTQKAQVPLASFKQLAEYGANAHKDTDDAEFWRAELEGAAAAKFPCIQVLQKPRASEVFEQRMEFPTASDHSVAALCRAAWSIVLAANSGSQDVTFGMFLLGRTVPVPGIEDVVGPVVAKVPVRVVMNSDTNVGALLHAMHEQAARTMPHEQMGIHNIRELSDSTRAACEFQTLLVVHPYQAGGAFESGIGMEEVGVWGFNPYALAIEVLLDEDQRSCVLRGSWDPRAITMPHVKSILGQMRRTLRQLSVKGVADVLLRDLEVF